MTKTHIAKYYHHYSFVTKFEDILDRFTNDEIELIYKKRRTTVTIPSFNFEDGFSNESMTHDRMGYNL